MLNPRLIKKLYKQMAETISFLNFSKSNPNSHLDSNCLKSKKLIPQKIISSFSFEEESQKVFVALDLENYLYLWFLKNEIIDAISFLDESESEEKKNLFPDLCFDLSAFIAEYYNYSKERRIFISSFGYLGNSNEKFIKLLGNFDSIVIESAVFFEYVRNQYAHNSADLNYYESILNDSFNAHLDAEGHDREFRTLENNLAGINNNSLLDADVDYKNKSKLNTHQQQSNKPRKLKIIRFNIPSESLLGVNDYSFFKSEEERAATPITDLIQFSLADKSYLISTNGSNKILIASFSTGKITGKLIVPYAKNSIKTQITSIKQIPHLNLPQQTSEFSVALGSANGLIYFYTIKSALENSRQINDLECSLELKGIFSVFQNQFFNLTEAKQKLDLQEEYLEFDSKHLENLVEDFLNKSNAKDSEPINTMEINDNILFAGLNSFVVKFNLKLNLLTQVMPSLSPVNRILIDNGNIYVSGNSRNLLLFESRGVLISKIDTSLNCVYDMQKFWVKKRKYVLCCGNKNYLEVITNDSNFKLVF